MAKAKRHADSFLHPAERGAKMNAAMRRFNKDGYVMWMYWVGPVAEAYFRVYGLDYLKEVERLLT